MRVMLLLFVSAKNARESERVRMRIPSLLLFILQLQWIRLRESNVRMTDELERI
jgi:hypothetical protein